MNSTLDIINSNWHTFVQKNFLGMPCARFDLERTTDAICMFLDLERCYVRGYSVCTIKFFIDELLNSDAYNLNEDYQYVLRLGLQHIEKFQAFAISNNRFTREYESELSVIKEDINFGTYWSNGTRQARKLQIRINEINVTWNEEIDVREIGRAIHNLLKERNLEGYVQYRSLTVPCCINVELVDASPSQANELYKAVQTFTLGKLNPGLGAYEFKSSPAAKGVHYLHMTNRPNPALLQSIFDYMRSSLPHTEKIKAFTDFNEAIFVYLEHYKANVGSVAFRIFNGNLKTNFWQK